MIHLANYIGCFAGDVLGSPLFDGWHATRSLQRETAPEIWYEFEGHGVEIVCDEFDVVRTVFLHRGDGERLAECSFSTSREEVRRRFGKPTKSGAKLHVAGLGPRGAWDRFLIGKAVVHFQFSIEGDEIDMISIMDVCVVP